jgi:hypothetical protein
MTSIENLRKAIAIHEQIEKLQAELNALLQNIGAPVKPVKASAPKPAKKKGQMSAAGRAAIVAAQKARWAAKKAAGQTTLKKK